MKSNSARLSIPGSLAAAAALIFAAGCANSDPVTGPVPTNITGSWTGTYLPDDAVGCTNGSAEATFVQQGSAVTGTLSSTSDCGFQGIAFQGVLEGNTLTGSITGSPWFKQTSTAIGTLSATSLDLTLRNTVYRYSGGQMRLHLVSRHAP